MKDICEINGKKYKIYSEKEIGGCKGCVFLEDNGNCRHSYYHFFSKCVIEKIIYKTYKPIDINEIKQDIITWADKVDQNNIIDWIYYLNLYLKSLGWNKKARKGFIGLGTDGFNFGRLDYVTLWYNFYYDVAQYFKEDISIETILKLHIAYRNIRINCNGTVIV